MNENINVKIGELRVLFLEDAEIILVLIDCSYVNWDLRVCFLSLSPLIALVRSGRHI